MLSETKRIGTIGELMVYANLIEHGYDVFTAIGDCCKADAIITQRASNVFKRIQVKTVQRSTEGVAIATASKVISGKKVDYVPTDFDILALAVLDRGRVAYIPMSRFQITKSISLRFELPRNGQGKNITWFKDFERVP